jgi:CSLREA domain-containing protein
MSSLSRILIGGLLGCILSFPAEAATFVVNDTDDLVDASPGDGDCDAGGGECTLRAAIMESNALAGADVITLPSGVYTLTLEEDLGSARGGPTTLDDAGQSADLDILDFVTINGAGAASTIIQAGTTPENGIDRVFDVAEAAGLTLSDVTVRHGRTDGTGGGFQTGGSVVVLNDVVVTLNSADRGGGIYNAGSSSFTLNRVTLSQNTADKGAGLLNSSGTVTLADSTVSGNEATTQGGGLLNTGTEMSIDGSTISGNLAGPGGGGGIYNRVALFVTNSTISGNDAEGWGGGISNSGGAPADLRFVTIADNTSDDQGGGIYNGAIGSAVTVANTILDGNTAPTGPACSVDIISGGSILVDDTSGCTIHASTPADQLDVDALLGPLAANGGPTMTHALLAGSPAIDASLTPPCPATDQRGMTRPQGPACDVGSFEGISAAADPSEIPTASGTMLALLAAALAAAGVVLARRG